MREMIEQTLLVYQGLYDQSLAEEQAQADAAAIKKIKKGLSKASKSIPESPYVKIEPADKITKVRLLKDTTKTTDAKVLETKVLEAKTADMKATDTKVLEPKITQITKPADDSKATQDNTE